MFQEKPIKGMAHKIQRLIYLTSKTYAKMRIDEHENMYRDVLYRWSQERPEEELRRMIYKLDIKHARLISYDGHPLKISTEVYNQHRREWKVENGEYKPTEVLLQKWKEEDERLANLPDPEEFYELYHENYMAEQDESGYWDGDETDKIQH